MPQINPTLPEDGQSADASDISGPFLDLLAVFNGHIGSDNLEPGTIISSNLAANSVTTPKILDGAVTVPKLSNPYKFSVYRTASYTFPPEVITVAPFDTALYDTNNNVDIVTNKGRYTAPASGYYLFNASLSVLVSSGNVFWIELHKNGTIFAHGNKSVMTYPQFVTQYQITKNIYLAVGDYVEVAFEHNENAANGNGGMQIGTLGSFFEGELRSIT